MDHANITEKIADTLVKAGSTFSADKIRAYERAIEKESNPQSKWVMEQILENAKTAEKNRGPLCDDTGIPHVYVEIGKNQAVSGEILDSISEGVAEGLRRLPGRPMAVKGNDLERICQSEGMYEESEAVLPAPVQIRRTEEDITRVYILMEGGGPAIRGKDYRIFHRHSVDTVAEEIVSWAKEAVAQLGCTPCTLAIGIGRSHYEAAAMMMEAQVHGNYDVQSELEQRITKEVNESRTGALGLGGDTSVLATFLKVGPQRASGVRIVCLRPCCCFEPRVAHTEI